MVRWFAKELDQAGHARAVLTPAPTEVPAPPSKLTMRTDSLCTALCHLPPPPTPPPYTPPWSPSHTPPLPLLLRLPSPRPALLLPYPGTTITVKWRGKPVFVRHRTAEEIQAAVDTDITTLVDQQTDEERYVGPANWFVVLGVCTHLGCVPLPGQGDYKGWFCPCHGSHYDTSGRIRKGPAPLNLEVPEYSFMTDTLLKLG